MAVSNNNIDWDRHWQEHKNEEDFVDVNACDYFADLLPKNFKVLDIGCGSCRFYPLFKRLGSGEYVGVDFSATAVNLAKQKFPEINVFLMKVEEIDFNSYFDLVFSNTFLQHTSIDTKRKIFPKVWKALKQDGILVIQEKSDVDTPTTFTKENWIKFIEPFGFKFLKSTPEGDPRNGFVFKAVKMYEAPRYPEDYDDFYYLLFTLPLIIGARTVVETGLHNGNSTRIFLESSKVGGFKVYTCDIQDYPETRKRLEELGLTQNWDFKLIDSREYGQNWKGSPVDILYLDSHHSYEHIKAELDAWLPKLSTKAIILIHDTMPSSPHDMYKTGGPLRAINEFIREHPEWKAINMLRPEGMALLWRAEELITPCKSRL